MVVSITRVFIAKIAFDCFGLIIWNCKDIGKSTTRRIWEVIGVTSKIIRRAFRVIHRFTGVDFSGTHTSQPWTCIWVPRRKDCSVTETPIWRVDFGKITNTGVTGCNKD